MNVGFCQMLFLRYKFWSLIMFGRHSGNDPCRCWITFLKIDTWPLQVVKTDLAQVFSLSATCLTVLGDILLVYFSCSLKNVKGLCLLKLRYFPYSHLPGFSTQVLFLAWEMCLAQNWLSGWWYMRDHTVVVLQYMNWCRFPCLGLFPLPTFGTS